mgnify:CR=1 FL=1
MKRFICILLAAMLLQTMSFAQDTRHRQTITIIQDALAQMPARTADDFSASISDLIKTAPESVVVIADMMTDPSEGANSAMEYAISGMVAYASNPAHKDCRKVVVKGLAEAVEKATVPYVKSFLQSQLRLLKPGSFRKEHLDSYEVRTSEEAAQLYYASVAAASDVFVLSEQEEKEGFEILFDGTNLSKWTGNKEGYVVDNGTIKVTANYGGSENLYTVKEYRDFILRFEFFFEKPGVNNGVGIRTPMGVDAAYDGMCEVQVLDHDAPIYKGLMDYQVHGSAYGIIPAKRIKHKPVGQWSTEEIVVKGDNVKVTVNGEVILDGNLREACQGHNVSEDGSQNNPYTYDHKNHPGMFNETGRIGFLGHGEGLRYRYVRIKEL